MMKGSIGLIMVLCLSITSTITLWEDGKEYHFLEESAVQVGTKDLDRSASGLRMMSDVRIQVSGNRLVVSMDNVQEAHYSHSYAGADWPYRLIQEKVKDPKSRYFKSIGYEHGNTFSMVLEDGLVSMLELPEGLSMNGKNMMRAMASILQMDTTEHEMGIWSKKERSIHGECAFEYSFLNGDQAELKEVSKTVSHLRDCAKRNYKMFDNSGAYSCNGVRDDMYTTITPMGKDEQHDDVPQQMYRPEPIHSTSMTTFQMRELEPQKFKIEKIFSAGAVVVQRFSEEGPTHVTLANRTLTLIEVKDMDQLRSVENPHTYDNLEFEWMEGNTVWNTPLGVDDLRKKESFFYNGYTMDETQDDLMEAVKTNIRKHVEEMNHFHNPFQHMDEAIQKLHQHGIQNLLPFFHALNYDSLEKLKSFYLGLRTDNEMDKSARDVFVEMLPVSGTWPAALVVQEMVMMNDLKSDMETARIMISIPFHVEPVKALVDEFYKLVKSDKPHLQNTFTKSAIDLSYAHLVRRTCHEVTTQQECFKALHVEDFINRFDALTVDDHAMLKHLMLVFHNFCDSDILEHKLKTIVFNETPKKYDGALREKAIFALASIALRKGLEKDYFLPIFLTKGESHEVRIAAFDVLMKGTQTTTTFNKIMTYMIYETDYEVFNYVYTAFEKFATQSNEPCGQVLHKYANYFIKYWKQHMWQKPKYTFGVSKTFSNSFTQEKFGYSGSVEVNTIGSHKATTPLSIMVDVTSQRYHHVTMQVFGMYIRMEGVAEKVVDKIKEFVFSGKFEFEKLKEVLFTNMNIRQRPTVPAKLDFVFMMRDNVVLEYHLVDTEITGIMAKLRDYLNQVRNMQDIFKFNRHFRLGWDMFVYEQPTDFGVPMAYASGANSVLGLLGEVRKDNGIQGEVDFRMHLNTGNTDMMMVIHPDQKIRFSVQQDRTFKHQIKSAVTAVLDYSTRKLMVAVKVPEAETPFSMLGHSQTFIYTSNNKIVGSQIYLKKSCPTCLMKQVVSQGEDHRKNTNLMKSEYHELGHVYGLEIAGKLFDCEVPETSSPGQRFFSFLKSFNPLSKEPRSLLNILFSGTRQIHAFLFYFPHIESCGAHFMVSRSQVDPIEEIIFEFDLRKFQHMENPKKIMGEKSIAVVGNIIFSGVINRTHHVEMEFAAAPMWTKSNFDLEIRRMPFMLQSKKYPEFPILFHMNNQYFGFDRPILFKDLTSVEKHTVHSTIELIWGHLDQKIKIEGDHKTTAEAISHLHSKWYYNTCMRDHSLPEWRQSEYLPTTDACLYALHDLVTLHHFTWDITATNLEPWMVAAYKKMETLLKTALFPFWKFTPEYSTHEIAPRQPNMRIEQVFHTKQNTFDLTLQNDKDVSKFMGINYGLWQWNAEPYLSLSKLNFFTTTVIQPEMMTYLYYNNIINHCHATSQSVRTYDNVTYPYTMDHSCWTLISSDCYEHPSFAVFIKKTEKAPVGMMAFIGDQRVELTPMEQNKFQVKINDQDFDLQDNGFLFWPLDRAPVENKVFRNFLFKIIRRQNSYVLDFFPQMMINYDGNSVQVLAGPHVKGQNCGMCGDFNMNTHHEFLDPQMCHLKNGDEMARAWSLDTKYCSDKVTKPVCT